MFFYFESIDNLLVALLDWMLERTIVAPEHDRASAERELAGVDADPATHLVATVATALRRLPRHRDRVELFFDYWVLGTRHPAVRRKIRRALAGYRESYVAGAQAVIDADLERYAGTSADALADVIASFLYGCSMQLVTNPAQFDADRTLAALDALVRHPVPA